MADYAPPSGPPPPKVPEGWKAVWNAQYSEWFFVNIYTKQSQWEKPTEPVYPPGEGPPSGPPPGYAPSAAGTVNGHSTGTSEKSGFSSNNPYATMTEDEKLARKLQEEEQARVRPGSSENRGQANDYYNQPAQPQYGAGYPQQSASPYPQAQGGFQDNNHHDKGKSRGGILGKILGKASGSSSHSSHAYPPQQQYGYGQPAYGGAPGGYYGGGYPPRPMGAPMMGGGYGRRPGGGMGPGGGMALGAGAGLLGGAMLGSAMADSGGDTYIENNYGDDGDMGGDMGDMGDMGGDF